MNMRACLPSRLLCQQVYHVELLKCRKHGNQHRRSNNRADCGNRNKVRPLEPVCTIENCTLVAAMIHRLQCTIHNHNHKRQRQPKVDNRAAEKCRDIVCQPAHCRQPQLLHPLVQQTELRIEDAGFPEQDRHIARHGPRDHKQCLVDSPALKILYVQKTGQHKGNHKLLNAFR